MKLINTSFRLICGQNSDFDRLVLRTMIPQVPSPGEVVSLKGHPYLMHERSWAFDKDGESYAYCRVSPLRADCPYPEDMEPIEYPS
jgi:hypothetical protein